MKNNYVINIGRQLGSGGREIGEKLAKRLGISFYDKELINLASEESGLCRDLFEKADEKTTHSIFSGLLGMSLPFVGEGTIFSGGYLSNEALFKVQSDVILDLAQKGSCLFVGRCADYILRNHPRVINVFISADEPDRVARLMALHQLSKKEAEGLIVKTDRGRSDYYNYFSNKTWGAAVSYHLCINSSVLGIEGTLDYLETYVRQALKL